MPQYQGTTKRRYMWGIAAICALLFSAVVVSGILSDRFAVTFRIFGSDFTLQITRTASPVAFWSTAATLGAAAVTAVLLTSRGLSRVQRDERRNA